MSKIIQPLTKEQQAELPAWRREWLYGIGLCTDPSDRDEAERGAIEAYIENGNTPPLRFIWVDSAFAGMYIAHLIEHDLPFEEALENPLQHFENQNVISEEHLNDRGERAYYNTTSMYGPAAHFHNQGSGTQVTLHDLQRQEDAALYGSHAAGFIGFYNYLREVGGVEEANKLKGQTRVTKSSGRWWAFATICVMSERHSFINIDENNRVHATDGPALKYPDGWCMNQIRDMRVEPWMVNTPAHKLDPIDVLKIENVQTRAEVMLKMGVERLATHPDMDVEVVDVFESDDLKTYELIHIKNIPNMDAKAMYLKMQNESVPGMYHVEGVPSDSTTAKGALAWRNRDDEYVQPEQLT